MYIGIFWVSVWAKSIPNVLFLHYQVTSKYDSFGWDLGSDCDRAESTPINSLEANPCKSIGQ